MNPRYDVGARVRDVWRALDVPPGLLALLGGRALIGGLRWVLRRHRRGCGCLLVAGLLALLLACALGTWLVRAAHAAPVPAGAVLLVPAHPAAPRAARVQGVFARAWVAVAVPAAACAVLLAGDPAGTQPFAVDDRLTLIAHLADGTSRRWAHDFRAGGRIVPLPPTPVSAALGGGWADLEVVLEDLAPDTWGNTAIWLLPCAQGRPALPTPMVTVAPPPPAAPAAGGGSLLAPAAGGVLLGLGACGLALATQRRRATRRRRALALAGAPAWLQLYDAASREQIAQALSGRTRELGIARQPLRVVDARDAAAVARLDLGAGEGVVRLRVRAGPAAVQVRVDGQPVAAEVI